ncbi:hypothetical protein V5799_005968 [Amblyomma americanum]|uniref:Gustatory receptor n=1 Tax=Amblyomma americanum TaxID=6943 RepID=A0AAQ4DXQ8_AMBAM
MERNYRIHARLHRICGCFFISGMSGGAKQVPARVGWKSWSTLYSCALMGLVIWLDVDVIVTKFINLLYHGDQVHHTVRVVVHSILFIRMVITFLYAFFKSSKLLAFYLRASAFERRIGMTFCENTAFSRFFWSDVREASLGLVYCVVYTLTLTKLPPYNQPSDLGESLLKQVYYWLKILLTVIFYYVYDSVCTVTLRSTCEVLAEYLRRQLRILKACLSLPDDRYLQLPGAARCVESVRLNVAYIRRLKEEINDIWGIPLTYSTFCLLVVVCGSVYEICREGIPITQQSSLVVYTLWLLYCFVKLASASQSLTDAMTGTVITYTVILVQTNQRIVKSHLSDLNETSAVNHSVT